jgi:hypothetical protein
MRTALPLLLAAAAALNVGCFSKSIQTPMQPVASPGTTAPPGFARVLIVRPGRHYGLFISHHVTDGARAYLGDAINNSVFAADLAPGPHELCVGWGSGAGPLLKASLAAGKTYVVRVDIGSGHASLTPMRPNTDDMKEILSDMPNVRGSQLIGPNAEDALTASDVTDTYNRCVAATKDAAPEDNAKLLLREDDSL